MSPTATLRLQFHAKFTFADAERLVPYFASLGISHLYCSPITTARPGSMHGYDVIDPTSVNPELGGEEAGVPELAGLHSEMQLGLTEAFDQARFGQSAQFHTSSDIGPVHRQRGCILLRGWSGGSGAGRA